MMKDGVFHEAKPYLRPNPNALGAKASKPLNPKAAPSTMNLFTQSIEDPKGGIQQKSP